MKLTDVNARFPRLRLNKPLEKQALIKYIATGSTFTSGDIMGMIYAIREALLNYLKEGTPVRLEGIGIFSPSIKLDGTIKIRFRADKELLRELNSSHNLHERITNRKNLGKSLSDLEED